MSNTQCPNSRLGTTGGQAVLEGIMMKGPDRSAVAVRQPNGNIHMKVEPLKDRSRWFKIPIIRGVFIFVDALVTGTRTLLYSAEVLENAEGASGEAVEKDKMTIWLEKKFGEKGALNVMLYMSVVLAILLTVGIFIVVPTVVTHLFQHVTTNPVWLNLFEGVLRIVIRFDGGGEIIVDHFGDRVFACVGIYAAVKLRVELLQAFFKPRFIAGLIVKKLHLHTVR